MDVNINVKHFIVHDRFVAGTGAGCCLWSAHHYSAQNILLPSFVTSCRRSLHFDHYSSYYWGANTAQSSTASSVLVSSLIHLLYLVYDDVGTSVVSGWIKNPLCLIKRSKDCLPPLCAKYLISGHWFKIWALLISDLPRIPKCKCNLQSNESASLPYVY